jgi:hypothetical protein
MGTLLIVSEGNDCLAMGAGAYFGIVFGQNSPLVVLILKI